MTRDRAYYLDTYIAGRLYGDADLAWPHLEVGQQVILVREADNENDSAAIAVFTEAAGQHLKLGYIPFRKNQPLALMLDMGWGEAFGATISRLDPSATYDRQIGITIRILRNHRYENP
ncbi:MAG: HIRAN domain-containing protein [Muribaculaceae bacterium]|nr:HIRAN domain-containing protein [Muribaculaceae bacterium]